MVLKQPVHLKNVEALSNYTIRVEVGSGSMITYDFTPKLDTIRFSPLKDESFFNSVRVEGNGIIFTSDKYAPVKITVKELLDMVF